MFDKAFETKCMPCTDESLLIGENLLRQGEVISVPTETVYGLAADATNDKAIEKIYSAKGRPSFNPLIVHIGSHFNSCQRMIAAGFIDEKKMSKQSIELADLLIKTFWPGPLTIIMPSGPNISPMVARGLQTVGFRMPGHPDFLKLLDRSGMALAAPSANRSNRISPTLAEHVLSELSGRISLVLDGGACAVGLESTIVEIIIPSAELRLLRYGATPCEAIEAQVGFSLKRPVSEMNILAPGMLREHYSPTKPVFLVDEDKFYFQLHDLAHSGGFLKKISILIFSGNSISQMEKKLEKYAAVSDVSSLPDDDLIVGKILFQRLRLFDESDAQILMVVLPKNKKKDGLWPAIWDKLTRAASRWSSLGDLWNENGQLICDKESFDARVYEMLRR